MSRHGRPELLDAVARATGRARAAGRSGGEGDGVGGRGARGSFDAVEVATRVAWSVVAEPGDAIAGGLVDGLGAAPAFESVLAASDDGIDGLLGVCVERGVAGTDDPSAYARALTKAVDRWRPRLATADVGAVLAAAEAVGARLLVPGGPGWPERVDDLGHHAPLVLWSRSALGASPSVLEPPAVAVVGSRANTIAGSEAAADISSRAVDAGCVVVSGGAYGIDATAHRVAIAAGATTVAVLAGGVDQLYPTGNVELLRNVSQRGAVIAESPPGTRPSRWRFLARNRLIAALADVTVVVEAGARSGALNTAHHAGQLGRTVFAVPGAFSSAASVGCHRLVAQGRAQLMVHPDEAAAAAIEQRGGVVLQSTGTPLLVHDDPDVLRALDALGRRSLSVDEVARRSGLSIADATDALALAQVQGLVQHGVGGWSRVTQR
ncbi:DNA-processing protein DprA [Curtobacterium sp. 458]|uniref:DNA-processing protein DprA n=1 Tax=Curtobacterium sp. 458 TaxID=3050069 RepID=UPI0025B43F92|nr:DNA-processing protein DprA [Curtobacterium sp. 458]WJX99076.1 DNA-processing protein DprA [Curtobacterium sp. 458]